MPRGGSTAGTGKPSAAESNTVPANVQTAFNTYTNPPAGTGGLKPTRQMAAQFEQYGLTGQVAPQPPPPPADTRIGSTMPDGSVKGDRNRDGRFGLQDFILRKQPAQPAPVSTATPSADDIVAGRSDLYGFKKPQKPKLPPISSDDLQNASKTARRPPRRIIPLAGTWNPNMPSVRPAR